MIFADLFPDSQIVSIIIQGGSMGLLAVIIVYAGRHGFPALLDAFKQQGQEFRDVLMKMQERHERELDKRDLEVQRRDAVCDKFAEAALRLAARIDLLEAFQKEKT